MVGKPVAKRDIALNASVAAPSAWPVYRPVLTFGRWQEGEGFHREGEVAPEVLPKTKQGASRSPKVLVVDDDLFIITTVTDLLLSHGYRVVTARDGRAGLTQAQRERPDLIILDLVMPEMTGHEVTRQLRQDPEFRQIPIIILTAQTEPDAREKALRSGADSYMVKPVNAELLLTQIRSLLLLRSSELS